MKFSTMTYTSTSAAGLGRHVCRVAHGLALMLALAGCSILPDAPDSRLHTLELVPPATTQACAISFSIRDLRLAGYLERAEVIVGRDASQVFASSLDLWAAPLRDELRRTMTRSLQQRWLNSTTVNYPWRFGEQPQVALNLSIDRLDPVGAKLESQADWQLIQLSEASAAQAKPGQGKVLASGRSERSVEIGPRSSAGATVAAINRSVALLADEISQAASNNPVFAGLCVR